MGADEVGPVVYPGTGDDLRLESEVNFGGSPLSEVKSVSSGDLVSVRLLSPSGTLDFDIPFLAAQLFATGTPLNASFAGFHFDLGATNAPILLIDGLSGGLFGPLPLPPGGLQVFLAIPAGLAGQSVLLQGATLSSLATNGLFASTDGHELQGN